MVLDGGGRRALQRDSGGAASGSVDPPYFILPEYIGWVDKDDPDTNFMAVNGTLKVEQTQDSWTVSGWPGTQAGEKIGIITFESRLPSDTGYQILLRDVSEMGLDIAALNQADVNGEANARLEGLSLRTKKITSKFDATALTWNTFVSLTGQPLAPTEMSSGVFVESHLTINTISSLFDISAQPTLDNEIAIDNPTKVIDNGLGVVGPEETIHAIRFQWGALDLVVTVDSFLANLVVDPVALDDRTLEGSVGLMRF